MQSRSLGPIVAGLGGAVYTRFMSVVAPVVGNSKYRNLLQLGEGATANVYLAVAHGPSGFNKLVVMKTLKQALVEDLTYRQMFLQEARLAARLNHPNIVQTNEVTEEGPAPSIVMEFLEGQAFSSILSRARRHVPLGLSLRIILDVLAGLHYAHELRDYDDRPLSLVHRDVTPHNVFVTYEGQVKVLDFGIAKIATAGIQTQEGVVKGKIRYMPQEQILGGQIDRRADIFAVGVMLWEALVGERMWKGHSDVTVMSSVLNAGIPAPSTVRADVNRELDRICSKALAHNRDERYATAADFENELEAAATALSGSGLTGSREIGRFVAEHFGEARRQVKARIDDQLSKVTALSWDEYEMAAHAPPALSHTMSATRQNTEASIRIRPVPKRGHRLLWVACGAGAVVLLLVGQRYLWPAGTVAASPTAVPDGASAQALSPGSPSRPETLETVSVRLQASPAEATIFVDGTAVPNPYVGSLPRGKGKHSLRVEADGYVTKTEDLVAERDITETLTLERTVAKKPVEKAVWRPAAAPARPAAGGRPAQVAQASPQPAPALQAASPTPSRENCSMPYFIDERGIKKIKPECM